MTAPVSRMQPMITTQTPWLVSSFEQGAGGVGRVIMGADNFSIAHVMDRTPAENEVYAAFIVEAVNSHASLKEQVAWWEEQGRLQIARIQELEGALQRMVSEFDDYHYEGCPADRLPGSGPCNCFAGALLSDARAALQPKDITK